MKEESLEFIVKRGNLFFDSNRRRLTLKEISSVNVPKSVFELEETQGIPQNLYTSRPRDANAYSFNSSEIVEGRYYKVTFYKILERRN